MELSCGDGERKTHIYIYAADVWYFLLGPENDLPPVVASSMVKGGCIGPVYVS